MVNQRRQEEADEHEEHHGAHSLEFFVHCPTTNLPGAVSSTTSRIDRILGPHRGGVLELSRRAREERVYAVLISVSHPVNTLRIGTNPKERKELRWR